MNDFGDFDDNSREKEEEAREEIKGIKGEELLELLADVLSRDLVIRIMAGTASPSDRNTARQLLKDAGIELAPDSKQAANLVDVLGDAPYDDHERGTGETEIIPKLSLARVAKTGTS